MSNNRNIHISIKNYIYDKLIKEIIIPKEVEYLISIQKNERLKERIRKVYDALLFKKGGTKTRVNKNGVSVEWEINKNWFDVPSNYLKKINSRYNKVIDLFLEYGIIEYQKSQYNLGGIIEYKKSYCVDNNRCMKYRFLIDIKKGKKVNLNINVENLYRNKRWFNITKRSLIEIGLEPRIVRDNFSRRLHTNVTGNLNLKYDEGQFNSYKDYCKGFYTIDSVTSQPRLLWKILKDNSQDDKTLSYIFENDIDFYDYLINKVPTVYDRDTAKDLFAQWVNGTGYLDDDYQIVRKLFPVATNFIRNYKNRGYKDMCRLLQYKEASIWVDDLLENLPTEFGLSVHDSLIVKKDDVDKVLEYCEKKHPQLRFKKELID